MRRRRELVPGENIQPHVVAPPEAQMPLLCVLEIHLGQFVEMLEVACPRKESTVCAAPCGVGGEGAWGIDSWGSADMLDYGL